MRPLDLSGMRFGRLVAIKFHGIHRQPNRESVRLWLCQCDCGSESIVRSTALRSGNTTSCGCYHYERLKNDARKEVVAYCSAHDRVRAARGRAGDQSCIDCGVPAKDWSYNLGDPAELIDGPYRSRYSLDPAFYVPRCRKCHKRFDVRNSRKLA